MSDEISNLLAKLQKQEKIEKSEVQQSNELSRMLKRHFRDKMIPGEFQVVTKKQFLDLMIDKTDKEVTQ